MTRLAFRGTVTATAFVLDVPLIGEAEARQRALDWWGDGARVHSLPGGAWLLVLATPVTVLAERAPGLPLLERDGGLVAPGFQTKRGAVAIPVAGEVHRHLVDELPLLDLAAWVDLTEILVHRLSPADIAPAEPVRLDETTSEVPDLRKAAKIGRRSARMQRLITSEPRPASSGRSIRIGRKVGAVVIAVVLVLAVAGIMVAVTLRGSVLLAIFIAAMFFGWSSVRGERDSGEAAPHGVAEPIRQRKARSGRRLFRTPIWSFMRSRHERYLRRLTQLFERRQWEDALREAIAIGDSTGDGALGLGLPRRRTSALQPSTSVQSGGRSVPYGPELTAHLRDLYRTAATELERDGRIDEAAFVHADLLNDPAAAVALLERHGRLRLAAELAEGRDLDPDLVVRLWWIAGHRDRALDVARVRGAFAAAIELLSRVDKAGARELRVAWVHDRQQAGDHIGAVAAAWPEQELRSMVVTSIQSGMALGGAASAHLFAYLLSEWPTDQTQSAALALLDSSDEVLIGQREQFVSTLAGLTVRDPVADRMIATAAVRAVVRDVVVDQKAVRHLAGRADPLLAADLPPSRSRDAAGALALQAPIEPGQLPIYDAVTLDGGAILVAQGELGVRLLTLDGRTRSRWSVPAHQLVVANHGGSALLVARYGQVSEIHRLDLATRRVQRWTSIRVKQFLPSYDGSIAVVIDDEGLAFLDVHADQPRVVWRELDRGTVIHAVNRGPQSLAAFVDAELWRWELPGMTLRSRVKRTGPDWGGPLLASGVFTRGLGPLNRHSVSGDMVAYRDEKTAVYASHETEPLLTATFPHDEQLNFRSHAKTVTLWDNHGRLVAADVGQNRALASFALSPS